jgi:hypothetical protein
MAIISVKNNALLYMGQFYIIKMMYIIIKKLKILLKDVLILTILHILKEC